MDAGLKATLLIAGALLTGCAHLGYYAQLAKGQMELLSRREPIAEVVGNPQRDPELRRRLALVLDARSFAIATLALPDNASYTLYADLGRPYALWNVMATPEFSLEPIESCFLIAGCVAYRGHYSLARAQAQVEDLRRQGYDVDIGGVPAYSTLGWFDDPVLNTMMHWSDAVLIGTVFHELAHQRLYVQDDTAFNESYARFVEQQGLREYFRGGQIDEAQDSVQRERERQFTRLVLETRARLATLYALPLSPEAMRSQKNEAFAQLRADYVKLRDQQWDGAKAYDAWFERDLNNASLLPFGLYDESVPSFARLFEDSGRDWKTFHEASRALGALPKKDRRARLRDLAAPMPDQAPAGPEEETAAP